MRIEFLWQPEVMDAVKLKMNKATVNYGNRNAINTIHNVNQLKFSGTMGKIMA